MFDIGFSELVVIGIVALIVLGPERLPKVARTAGHLFGRLQRYVSEVKAEVKREMHNEEVMKLQTSFQEAKDAMADVGQSIKSEATETGQLLKAVPDEPAPSLEFVEEPVAHEATRRAPLSEPTPQMELQLPPLEEPPLDQGTEPEPKK
jgi:sec-independent protein translocase protein TatB